MFRDKTIYFSLVTRNHGLSLLRKLNESIVMRWSMTKYISSEEAQTAIVFAFLKGL